MDITLCTMVAKLFEEKNWLCVISSDKGNKGVDINDDCKAMMGGGGRRFFVFDVSTELCCTWVAVGGALEDGSKVFVLHFGTGDPPFPKCASFACTHPVPQSLSYEEHVHKTFGEMKTMFDKLSG
jgi:hypothetical protein